MAEEAAILPERIEFAPVTGDELEAWLAQTPAKWAVALMADEAGRPVQLLSARNLRLALRYRLDAREAVERRANLREVVRQISWQRVDSEFEAGWVYLEAARRFLPLVHRELAARTQAWFVHIDPEDQFPRYLKTTDLAGRPGKLLGPLADKHAAARWIEMIEDAFDLCRYHHILVQSPGGKACPYKEMGKCPAPCDGSISIEQYRRMVEISVLGVLETGHLLEQQARRMEQAAAELRFETAARIKAHVEQLGQLGRGTLRYARPIEEFAFVTVQAGPRKKQSKVFLVLPGGIEAVACLVGDKPQTRELVHSILTLAEEGGGSAAAADSIGLVARYLFAAKAKSGVFIPLSELCEEAITAAHRTVSRKTPAPADKAGIAPEAGYE